MIVEAVTVSGHKRTMVFLDDPPPSVGDQIPECPCEHGKQIVGISHYGFDVDYIGFTLCQCGRRHNIVYRMGDSDWSGYELIDTHPMQVHGLS